VRTPGAKPRWKAWRNALKAPDVSDRLRGYRRCEQGIGQLNRHLSQFVDAFFWQEGPALARCWNCGGYPLAWRAAAGTAVPSPPAPSPSPPSTDTPAAARPPPPTPPAASPPPLERDAPPFARDGAQPHAIWHRKVGRVARRASTSRSGPLHRVVKGRHA
jgi:hypothetical protein